MPRERERESEREREGEREREERGGAGAPESDEDADDGVGGPRHVLEPRLAAAPELHLRETCSFQDAFIYTYICIYV